MRERARIRRRSILTCRRAGVCIAYGDVPDPMELYRGKDCVEQFVDHVENEVKRLYELYPQQPMTELTEVLKREHEAAESCHICLMPFDDPENRGAT